jgi:glycosyltransferase involved in cell wall biosynthesis
MTSKRKVAIIGTVGLPANYGGFETLAEHLVDNLNSEYDFTVYCSEKRYSKEKRQKTYNGAKLKYLPFNANGMQSIIYDSLSILHAAFTSDVLLVLGVAGAWMLPFIKLFTNKKIIISIDGIEWKRDKWSRVAKWYLFWAESLAVKYSHIDISDNESIQDYTAMRYNSLSRIIEYGADHTMKVKPNESDLAEFPFLKENYAFKVCRIEPENNVHVVLEAFSKLPKKKMVMVGNWTNSDYGKEVRAKYSAFSNILLLDPIYDQRKLDVIRGNAHIYVHGHSAGGTNPSLVEAMYLKLPVVAFDVSYNRTTTENKALYFNNVEELSSIINYVTEDDLSLLSATMENIAQRRYTWKYITNKYKELVVEALLAKSKIKVKNNLHTIEESNLISMSLGHLKHQQMFFEKR